VHERDGRGRRAQTARATPGSATVRCAPGQQVPPTALAAARQALM